MSERGQEPFRHPAVFYRGMDEYLAALVPFVEDGLAGGEPVAVAVPGDNGAVLRAALGQHTERVRWIDMTVAGRNPGWIIPGVLRAFADAHPQRRVRIVGEPIWPTRSAEEYPACVQHEALINYAFQGRQVTIVCPYDARLLSPDVLADAEATHPVLIDTALIDTAVERPSPRYRPDEVLATYDTPLTDPPVDASTHEVSVRDLSAARRLVARQASEYGLPPLRVADVALVADELLANSIEHGAGTATLRMWSTDTALVCQVEGTARLTNPLAGRIPAPPGQHRGRGLLIVNRLADLVRTHTSTTGTTIRAYFTPTSDPDLDTSSKR